MGRAGSDSNDQSAILPPPDPPPGPLDRARVEDGRRDGASAEIFGEDLVPVDVAGEDGGEHPGQISAADHIPTVSKGEIRRTHGCSFDTLMDAEQPDVGGLRPPLGGRQEIGKPPADIPALEGEPGQAHGAATHFQ
jgi:hypothetical protein